MPDWVYELVEAFVAFTDRVTLVDAVALMLVAPIVAPVIVLIHEAGHALAAFALRRRVAELTVGDDVPVLMLRLGGFRMRLGAITGKGDAAGFIRYDGAGAAAARDTLAIALAGPLASVAGALVTAVAAAWVWPLAGLSQFFALATLGGIICCAASLRVSGDGPASWSDGVWVRAAWRAMRRPTPHASGATWPDPREVTSIPPPAERPAS